MKSIKNISIILKNNGLDSENYSEDDINALNVSLSLTKLIYRIINTPLLDENGNIEKIKLLLSEPKFNINQKLIRFYNLKFIFII